MYFIILKRSEFQVLWRWLAEQHLQFHSGNQKYNVDIKISVYHILQSLKTSNQKKYWRNIYEFQVQKNFNKQNQMVCTHDCEYTEEKLAHLLHCMRLRENHKPLSTGIPMLFFKSNSFQSRSSSVLNTLCYILECFRDFTIVQKKKPLLTSFQFENNEY
jgi:hypothetical protein